MPVGWREIRVFISSTFRDMQAERDHLVRFVFPRLREELLKRRMHLVDVDLRWGVTADQDAFELCVDEIKRCHPRFLCMLGGRYGWVPPPKTVDAEFMDRVRTGNSPAGRLTTEQEVSLDRLYTRDQDAGLYRLRERPRLKAGVEVWNTQAEVAVEMLQRAGLSAAEASITASEIHYGALDRLHEPAFRYFYFRDPAVTNSIPEPHAGTYREREGSYAAGLLAVLKQRIADSTGRVLAAPDKVVESKLPLYEYRCRWDPTARISNLKAFGDQVYADILASVDAEFGTAPPEELDELAEQKATMEGFIELRVEHYVVGSRQPIFAALRTHAEGVGGAGCLVVVGEPGSGKSALLGKFYMEYVAAHPNHVVIPHFVGASAASTNIRLVLRRFCRELAAAAGLSDEVPDDYDKVRAAFPVFLEKAAAVKHVIILMDAINQLDPAFQAHRMRWVPETLPANARIILTVLPGPYLDAVRARHVACQEKVLPVLTEKDATAIIDSFLRRYRKTLEEEQRVLVLAKHDAGKPLYLLTALEELRTLGTYEEITDRIKQLPGEAKPLFVWILKRLEEDDGFRDQEGRKIGRDLVRRYCSYLAVGRSGMAQDELAELVAPAPLRRPEDPEELAADPLGNVATLQCLLRAYLMNRGGLLDFSHGQLREAVEERYLTAPTDRRLAHHAVGGLFLSALVNLLGEGLWGPLAAVSSLPERSAEQRRALRALSEVMYHVLSADALARLFRIVRSRVPHLRSDLLQQGEETLADLRQAAEKAGELGAKGWAALLDTADTYCDVAYPLTKQLTTYERLIADGKIDSALTRLNAEPDQDRRGAIAIAVVELMTLDGYPADAAKLLIQSRRWLNATQHIYDAPPDSKDARSPSALHWRVQVLTRSIDRSLDRRTALTSGQDAVDSAQLAHIDPQGAPARPTSRRIKPVTCMALNCLTYVIATSADLGHLWFLLFPGLVILGIVAAAVLGEGYTSPILFLLGALALFMRVVPPTASMLLRSKPDLIPICEAFVDSTKRGPYRRVDRHLKRLLAALDSMGGVTDRVLSLIMDHVARTPDARSVASWSLRLAGLRTNAIGQLLGVLRHSARIDAPKCVAEVERLPKCAHPETLALLLTGLAEMCTPPMDVLGIVSRFRTSAFGAKHQVIFGGDAQLMWQTALACLDRVPLRQRCRALLEQESAPYRGPAFWERLTRLMRPLRRIAEKDWEDESPASEHFDVATGTFSTLVSRVVFYLGLLPSVMAVGAFFPIAVAVITIWLLTQVLLVPLLLFVCVLFIGNCFTRRKIFTEDKDAVATRDVVACTLSAQPTAPYPPSREQITDFPRAVSLYFWNAVPVARVARSLVAASLRSGGVSAVSQCLEREGFSLSGGMPGWRKAGVRKGTRGRQVYDELPSLLRRVGAWQWFGAVVEVVIDRMSRLDRPFLRDLRATPAPNDIGRHWDGADTRQLQRALPLYPVSLQGIAVLLTTLCGLFASLFLGHEMVPDVPASWWLLAALAVWLHCSTATLAWHADWGLECNSLLSSAARWISVAPGVGALCLLSSLWAFDLAALLSDLKVHWIYCRDAYQCFTPSTTNSLARTQACWFVIGVPIWGAIICLLCLGLLIVGIVGTLDRKEGRIRRASRKPLVYVFALETALFWTLSWYVVGESEESWRPALLALSAAGLSLLTWTLVAPLAIDFWRGSGLLYPGRWELLLERLKCLSLWVMTVGGLSIVYTLIV